ncbi:hypothetical protein EBU95_19070 [bacterium]|nr:hypothetical protein [bacterium]
MPEKIFFNSSLPRSLSTLLQNTLGQNPDFYVTPTSGLLELLFSARVNYTNSLEFKAQDPVEMERAWLGFCRGGINGYFKGLTDKRFIMEKSRGWGIHSSFLENILGEKPKIVCMVRDIKGIITSLEKIHRQQEATKSSGIVDHAKMANTSTAKRVDTFLNTQPLGLALERLNEILRFGWGQYFYFIRAEDFASNPERAIRGLYNYLELPYYEEHDFNNVTQITKEDDEIYGLSPTLHTIKPSIQPLKDDSQQVLGADICNWIDNNPGFDWFNQAFGYGKYKYKGTIIQ